MERFYWNIWKAIESDFQKLPGVKSAPAENVHIFGLSGQQMQHLM